MRSDSKFNKNQKCHHLGQLGLLQLQETSGINISQQGFFSIQYANFLFLKYRKAIKS